MTAFHDRIGLVGKLGHEASFVHRDKSRSTPVSGTRSHSGLCSQLVFDLVEYFFKQKEVQYLPAGPRVRRPQRRTCHDFTIGGKKSRGRAVDPFHERRAKPALLIRRQLERALQCRVCRRSDRPDQAGDVARRGYLAPPLLKRQARVAFEAGDEDVVLDDQHPAEIESRRDDGCSGRRYQAEAAPSGGPARSRVAPGIDRQAGDRPRLSCPAVVSGRRRRVPHARRHLRSSAAHPQTGSVQAQNRSSSLAVASARCISATRFPICDM